jgi:hypothetical protein
MSAMFEVSIMKTFRPALMLMVLAALLTELVTGSTPIFGFLNPGQLLFLFLGYSISILVLREWIVRLGLRGSSVFMLGIAYGIYNEGLWAKTAILLSDLPIKQFDGYGRIFDVNLPWILSIATYHAVAAVIAPILFVHLLYPAARTQQWLSKRLTAILTVVLVLLSCVFFLGETRITGTTEQMIALLVIMAIGVVYALVKRRDTAPTQALAPLTARPLYLGLTVFPVTLILATLAERQFPVLLYLILLALIPYFYARTLRTRRWTSDWHLALFCVGFMMQSALLGLTVGIFAGAPDRILVGVLLEVVFIIVVRRILKARRGSA